MDMTDHQITETQAFVVIKGATIFTQLWASSPERRLLRRALENGSSASQHIALRAVRTPVRRAVLGGVRGGRLHVHGEGARDSAHAARVLGDGLMEAIQPLAEAARSKLVRRVLRGHCRGTDTRLRLSPSIKVKGIEHTQSDIHSQGDRSSAVSDGLCPTPFRCLFGGCVGTCCVLGFRRESGMRLQCP